MASESIAEPPTEGTDTGQVSEEHIAVTVAQRQSLGESLVGDQLLLGAVTEQQGDSVGRLLRFVEAPCRGHRFEDPLVGGFEAFEALIVEIQVEWTGKCPRLLHPGQAPVTEGIVGQVVRSSGRRSSTPSRRSRLW
jgi:hypothetical protein